MNRWTVVLPVVFFMCLLANVSRAAEPFAFEDVSESSGLVAHFEHQPGKRPWRYAHGAAWGDVDGDGRPDLFAGAFAGRKWFTGDDAPVPNLLLFNRKDGFVRVDAEPLEARAGNARCAGAAFLDLDNDGDLDLVVTNHVQKSDQGGSRLFENQGAGKWKDVTPDEAPWTSGLGMRNVSSLDVNHDGRLDLILTDGSYGKGADRRAKLWVLANRGGWKFEDVGESLGFPAGNTLGLGLAVGDVNDDGTFDLFVAGCNRLFVSDASGKYREAHVGRFQFPPADVKEGLHCGAAFGDLNGDGLLDLITTEHGVPARLHVFHNRGVKDGAPDLVEVSETSGLGGLLPKGTRELPIKTAHVALRDMDHDGRVDIVTTLLATNEAGKLQPVVLRNLSERGSELRFEPPPHERLVTYYAPGPVADFDRDGRVDLFLPSWFEQVPNRLYRNTTKGGHGLTVRVTGSGKNANTMGIGAVVRAYSAGHVGEPEHLLARHDITVGTGYASGEEALAHLGLGEVTRCDIRVTWRSKNVEAVDVVADRLVIIPVN